MKNKEKIIYVDGSILIKTRFLKYKGGGALYDVPPEGAEQIKCNRVIDNEDWLVIEDDKLPSMFNKYYAKGSFTVESEWADFLHKDYKDDYKEYNERINDIKQLIYLQGVESRIHEIILRQSFLSIIASVETFICDTILTLVTQDNNAFHKYFNEFFLCKCNDEDKKKKQDALDKLWIDNELGSIEQKVVDDVLKSSYTRIQTIKDIYKILFDVPICDTQGKMNKHFYNRHIIAHRNGRCRKIGDVLKFSQDEIEKLISDANDFVKQIMDKIDNHEC